MSIESDGTKVPKPLDSPQNPPNFLGLSALQNYGLRIEKWVYDQLVSRGYSPIIPPNFSQEGCDMLIESLCIEVKAARKTKRKFILSDGTIAYRDRWQWFINSTHKTEYVLILVAETSPQKRYVFIVPGSQMGNRQHIQITSHPSKYSGWIAQYRDAWEVIPYLQKKVYLNNGPLYELWERAGESMAA